MRRPQPFQCLQRQQMWTGSIIAHWMRDGELHVLIRPDRRGLPVYGLLRNRHVITIQDGLWVARRPFQNEKTVVRQGLRVVYQAYRVRSRVITRVWDFM